MQQEVYYSNGKLLLSGEYLVLLGAKALAIPLNLGQDLMITLHPTKENNRFSWKSYENNRIWFEMVALKKDLSIQHTSSLNIANQLIHFLEAAKVLNPDFLNDKTAFDIQTNLNFNRNWGLGSSSTLINNIASWVQIDPFQLSDLTTQGSGYDIACASANQSIFYQKVETARFIENAHFDPVFKNQLYFVYLGKKQSSDESIAQFKNLKQVSPLLIDEISEISEKMASTNNISDFNKCMNTHERIISSILKIKSIHQKYFSNFEGELKSLGAWGGDYALISSQLEFSRIKNYFKEHGLTTIYKYSELSK